MGKVSKLHDLIALTGEMEITYLKTVPLFKPLVVEGWTRRSQARALSRRRDSRWRRRGAGAGHGHVHRSDAHRMFAEYLKKKRRDAT